MGRVSLSGREIAVMSNQRYKRYILSESVSNITNEERGREGNNGEVLVTRVLIKKAAQKCLTTARNCTSTSTAIILEQQLLQVVPPALGV